MAKNNKVVIPEDNNFWGKVEDYLNKHFDVSGSPEDIKAAFESVLIVMAATLKDVIKDGVDEAVLEGNFLIPTVTYRAGTGDSVGNFGISIVPGEEFKKAVKNDSSLTGDDIDEVID